MGDGFCFRYAQVSSFSPCYVYLKSVTHMPTDKNLESYTPEESINQPSNVGEELCSKGNLARDSYCISMVHHPYIVLFDSDRNKCVGLCYKGYRLMSYNCQRSLVAKSVAQKQQKKWQKYCTMRHDQLLPWVVVQRKTCRQTFLQSPAFAWLLMQNDRTRRRAAHLQSVLPAVKLAQITQQLHRNNMEIWVIDFAYDILRLAVSLCDMCVFSKVHHPYTHSDHYGSTGWWRLPRPFPLGINSKGLSEQRLSLRDLELSAVVYNHTLYKSNATSIFTRRWMRVLSICSPPRSREIACSNAFVVVDSTFSTTCVRRSVSPNSQIGSTPVVGYAYEPCTKMTCQQYTGQILYIRRP